MRILFSVYNLSRRGTYWRAFHLGIQLSRRGHEVSLISTSHQERVSTKVRHEDGLTIVEAPDMLPGSMRSGWDIWNIFKRIQWARKNRYDIVHSFDSRPTAILPALYITRTQGVPLIMDWCDWFGKGGSVEERTNPIIRTTLRPVETFFENNFRKYATGTTVICSKLHEKALKLGIPKKSILLLPNGANTENLKPLSLELSRQKSGLPKKSFIIGYIGSIFQRDAKLMGDAYSLLDDKIPDKRLLIIGYCPFDIKKYVRQPEEVIRTGDLDYDQLNEYLASCDIFWLPLSNTNANQGRFPLKLMDYMAAGRPIVSTAVGDIPTVFNQKQIGLLSQDNPKDISDQTLRLFSDPDIRKNMGNNARQLAESGFNWAEISKTLEAFYKRILRKPGEYA